MRLPETVLLDSGQNEFESGSSNTRMLLARRFLFAFGLSTFFVGLAGSSIGQISPCKPGEDLLPNGKCVPQCPPGQTRQIKPEGTLACSPAPTAKPCKPGEELGPNGKCVIQCPAGQVARQKPDGVWECAAPTPANPCKAGQELGPNGKCVIQCPAGQVRQQKADGSFRCITRVSPTAP
jgi:hypothetical protein